MTPEEKQSELKRHRDILLATFDYFIERSNVEAYGEFDIVAHYQQLKEKTEEKYQKGSLTWMRQCLRDMNEATRETDDFGYGKYIKEKTGYDLDVFSSFHKRIDKIIEPKQIKTENQYRDVMSMIDNLCQQTPVDQQKLDLLNDLIIDFEDKISGTKTPKSKRQSSSKEKHFFNVLLESPSPDNKRTLILTESGTEGIGEHTQVFIQFESSCSGVYAPNGINLGIKTYWKDNNTIVIETKKEFRATEKWEQIQNYKDIIKVEYIEKQ
ncbi:hypothetical protein [Cytophaga aurantiaca]|uniref:hypothetical protein n=1 Tax=Cytophaga aurantiaca TaxID=29530 RepID=UPI00035E008A|nr:hypothetical protein [Cytophaga aurantiaca]